MWGSKLVQGPSPGFEVKDCRALGFRVGTGIIFQGLRVRV